MPSLRTSNRYILFASGLLGVIAAILVLVIKYYEIRKASAEASLAESQLKRPNSSGTAAATPGTRNESAPILTPNPAASSKPGRPLVLLPIKSEDELKAFWKLPRDSSNWQIVNGGIKLPGPVQQLPTRVRLTGDCKIEFSCSTYLSWKAPAVRVFGETLGLPGAVGGYPITYHGELQRRGSSLRLEVEVAQPGLKRLETIKSETIIKSANLSTPSPLAFVWPNDMNLTISSVKITGETHPPTDE